MSHEDGQQSLKRLTRERFKQEVARELGIDLTNAGFGKQNVQKLEQDLHAADDADRDA
jgi:hypothetical protein